MAGLTKVRSWQARDFCIVSALLLVNVCMGQLTNWNKGQNAGLQTNAEHSEPLQLPSFRHQLHRDQVEKMNYRSSPERFDYLSLQQPLTNPTRFQQLIQRFGQFGQLIPRSHFPNPADFSQFNQPNLFRQSGYPSNPLLRGYSKRAEFRNGPDTRDPATEVENNEKYSFPQTSNHHQQLGYSEQNNEFRYLNLNENPKYSGNSQQLSNPDYFRSFNQQSPFAQTGPSSGPQLHSYLGKSQISSNHDFSSIKGPASTLENSETHLIQASNHQQHQGFPEQTAEPKDININGKSNNSNHLQQQSNPDTFHQHNQSNQHEKPEHSSELQEHINSTKHHISSNLQHTAANFTSLDQIQQKEQEHPNRVGNITDKNLTEQTSKLTSSQLQQLNPSDNTSNNNYSLHPEQLVNLNESQLHSNSTEDQHLTYTSKSQQSNPQNQSQQLNTQQTSNQQNVSSEMEHPLNSSEINITSNQSQLQEHSHVDHFQHNNKSDVANQFLNSQELKLPNNFTGYQHQNYSDSSNGNITANKVENSTSALQPSQHYIREQRQLHSLKNPSPMQYFFRSSQPQKFNPYNQIYKPNLFMQPMDQSNHHDSWTEHKEGNYHNPPAICYMEKMHGPCNGIIPSFFYNAVTKHCERFFYGGCLGNGNNFVTFEECESVCMVYPQNGHTESKYPQEWNYDAQYEDPALPLWHPGPALVHEFCSLEKRKGPCSAIFRRYFFNTVTKNCEEFIYGGCYGNANNFFTKEECEFVCTSL